MTTRQHHVVIGTLHHEIHWGPSNFGEDPKTDSKFTAWIVSLKKPVTIDVGKETGDEHPQSVAKIQLSFSVDSAVVGQPRLVNSDLRDPDSGHSLAHARLPV